MWFGGLRDKKDGYGALTFEGTLYRVHRFVYVWFNGATEKVIDHLCRNRLCCNPGHLEAVTVGENVRRGEGVAPRNAKKTHCAQGHEYTPQNTYVWNKQRFCRACHKTYTRMPAAERRKIERELADITVNFG